jgi:hypothetical protein
VDLKVIGSEEVIRTEPAQNLSSFNDGIPSLCSNCVFLQSQVKSCAYVATANVTSSLAAN